VETETLDTRAELRAALANGAATGAAALSTLRAAPAHELAEALGELSPRERVIIRQRRLREDGATLEELGRELGISKERVRQLEQRALRRLQKEVLSLAEHETPPPRAVFAPSAPP
jgi:DNA-directed RNA polymerase sigma subunit (sigma70/sigma32)